MKWCVSFPEEEILVVRPCLVAICMGNRPAAKLLSVLLYRYSVRKEHKDDAENMNEVKAARGEKPDQDTSFRIFRKQTQLIKDMCGEITEKTLCDTAVPMLQLLGYLEVDETALVYCYDVRLDLVIQALDAHKQGPKQLEAFILSHLQLEKVLLGATLEKVLLTNKKKFLWSLEKVPMSLEKVLLVIRKSSNVKRGPKPKQEAGLGTQNEKPQISIDCLEIKESVITPTLPGTQTNTHTFSENPVSPDYTTSTTIEDDETSVDPSMQLSTQANTNVDKSPPSNQPSHSRRATSQATHVGVAPVLAVPVPPRDGEVTPPSVKPAQTPAFQAPRLLHSKEAITVSAMYERVAGPGGYAKWDWEAMEAMGAKEVTEEDIKLVFTHLESKGMKRNVEQVWLNWVELPTLKNPTARRTRPTGPSDNSYHPELETDETRAARDAKNKAALEKIKRMRAEKEKNEQELAAKRERRAN